MNPATLLDPNIFESFTDYVHGQFRVLPGQARTYVEGLRGLEHVRQVNAGTTIRTVAQELEETQLYAAASLNALLIEEAAARSPKIAQHRDYLLSIKEQHISVYRSPVFFEYGARLSNVAKARRAHVANNQGYPTTPLECTLRPEDTVKSQHLRNMLSHSEPVDISVHRGRETVYEGPEEHFSFRYGLSEDELVRAARKTLQAQTPPTTHVDHPVEIDVQEPDTTYLHNALDHVTQQIKLQRAFNTHPLHYYITAHLCAPEIAERLYEEDSFASRETSRVVAFSTVLPYKLRLWDQAGEGLVQAKHEDMHADIEATPRNDEETLALRRAKQDTLRRHKANLADLLDTCDASMFLGPTTKLPFN